VIAKRADAPYVSRRSESWLKLKCKLRQEFVVAGYTDRSDGAAQIGSLLLGVFDDHGTLVSVGSVGTGWDTQEARDLKLRLAKIERATVPFAAGASKPGRWSKRVVGSERWVEPRTVAEVEFAEWTPDGQIRHASYVGLREDKPAKAVRRETARRLTDTAPMTSAGKTAVGGAKITHGERVIDASTGATKLDLLRYYESVADWLLPHLKGRPCSLVRGPNGVAGELFFQKHGEKIGIPGIIELPASLWPGHSALLEVASAEALSGAAQMNVIEFHTWNSTAKKIDRPDRMIFDLDPGEGTAWPQVQEAALLTQALLGQLGLDCWLKTSGGKGLHVVVPLTPRFDYDTVKAFSQAIVQHLAKTIPSRFVAKSGPANRVGKLFVDYLRNGFGATTAAAFSARARPGLGVSMPVAWSDLAKLSGGAQWTIFTAREHLSFQTVDPWAGYWKKKQSLAAAMKALGFKPPAAR
jgi:bifunctional non-homologous end joining protein LigD